MEIPKNKFEMLHTLPETGNVTVTLATVMEAAEQIEGARRDIERAIQTLRPDMVDWKKGIEKDERPSVQSLYGLYQVLDDQWKRLFELDIEVPVAVAQIAFNKANPLGYRDLATELRQISHIQD